MYSVDVRTSLSPDIVLRTRRRRSPSAVAEEGSSGDDRGEDRDQDLEEDEEEDEIEDDEVDAGHRDTQGNDCPVLLLLAVYLTLVRSVVVASHRFAGPASNGTRVSADAARRSRAQHERKERHSVYADKGASSNLDGTFTIFCTIAILDTNVKEFLYVGRCSALIPSQSNATSPHSLPRTGGTIRYCLRAEAHRTAVAFTFC